MAVVQSESHPQLTSDSHCVFACESSLVLCCLSAPGSAFRARMETGCSAKEEKCEILTNIWCGLRTFPLNPCW